jgi:sulfatase modifying factor 1
MSGLKLVSGPYTTRQLLDNVRAVEDALNDEFRFRGPITVPADQRDWYRRLCDVSAGKNVVLFNKVGMPSVMVHLKAITNKDLNSNWTEHFHPAFIRGTTAIPQLYIAKYQAVTVEESGTTYAISLRGRDPRVYVNFDQALQYCTANNKDGEKAWHLMTNAEWAYLALWCKANGYWPRGNNSYGKDYQRQDEWGEPTYFSGTDEEGNPVNRAARVATGTGPKESSAWSHDGTPFGAWDLNGNVYEWVGGMRLVDGEIQIIPGNDASDPTKDQGAASAEWKAILQDGTLVAPGTADTLKYDATGTNGAGHARLNTVITSQSDGTTYTSGTFQTATAAAGVAVPDLLKHLSLYPVDADHGGDGLYTRNAGERLPVRGGYWSSASRAGVCDLNLGYPRSGSATTLGFRPAFVP